MDYYTTTYKIKRPGRILNPATYSIAGVDGIAAVLR